MRFRLTGPRSSDRLTRSVAFLSRLLEAGVDVRFADLPQIDGAPGRFLSQQMVAVAELEAGMISRRTKDVPHSDALSFGATLAQNLNFLAHHSKLCLAAMR